MTDRTFYRNKITLVVLTEDVPLTSTDDVYAVLRECDEGSMVLHSDNFVSEEVTPKTMADLLYESGSEPGFFMLDDDGNTTED